ncbi:MAG: hypothetical protein IPM51_05640 [Sphingobacteriaceae bacterium]|nr:hypothetical protein [Sphingobacteriaceae bacterium]
MKKLVIYTAITLLAFTSCKKKETSPEPEPEPVVNPGPACPTCDFPPTKWVSTGSGPKLIFKFKFDSMQVRLNNLAQPTVVAAGNAGQSPVFNGMSAHYIELAQTDMTQVGGGTILYKANETECGGSKAITFCESVVCAEGDTCFSIPFSSITPGTYKWLRVSLAYQNYDIKVRANGQNLVGTIGSFVGFNTYVTKYKMKTAVMTPTAGGGAGNHLQGYWGFYTSVSGVEYKSDGQAPATTVVNPNFANSPIPPGSCLVTGEFYNTITSSNAPLVITGTETQDKVITISLSTNKSFEWKEMTFDGIFEPGIGETVVDMGLRGMIPKY